MPPKKRFKTDHDDPLVRGLEQARERVGYSQQRMAEALGVPFRTYQKWLYTDQRPRHGAALLARAQAMTARKRVNCWEVFGCGRETGGIEARRDGVCPAAVAADADGVNSGENGGRVCWAISGTFCGHESEFSASTKLVSCLDCDFFYQVLQEEGSASFKLLIPGQNYTQR